METEIVKEKENNMKINNEKIIAQIQNQNQSQSQDDVTKLFINKKNLKYFF